MVLETGVQSQVVSNQTQKLVLDATLLYIQHYKARIKGKWINPGNGVAPFPTVVSKVKLAIVVEGNQ